MSLTCTCTWTPARHLPSALRAAKWLTAFTVYSLNLAPYKTRHACLPCAHAAKWLTAFTWLEAGLDVFMMLGPGLCFYTFNEWVKDAMDAVKEREKRSKAAAAGAGAGAGGASSAKATARPSGGPRRRA